MVERLLRLRPAMRRPPAMLANQQVQLLFDVVELKPILLDAIVLDPRNQEQQEKRLLQCSAKATWRMHFHRPDLLQQFVQLLKIIGGHCVTLIVNAPAGPVPAERMFDHY